MRGAGAGGARRGCTDNANVRLVSAAPKAPPGGHMKDRCVRVGVRVFLHVAQHMLLIIVQEKLTVLQAKERPLALQRGPVSSFFFFFFPSVSYITSEYSFETDDALNIPSGAK